MEQKGGGTCQCCMAETHRVVSYGLVHVPLRGGCGCGEVLPEILDRLLSSKLQSKSPEHWLEEEPLTKKIAKLNIAQI